MIPHQTSFVKRFGKLLYVFFMLILSTPPHEPIPLDVLGVAPV